MSSAQTRLFHPPCGPIIAHKTNDDVFRALGIPYAQSTQFKQPSPKPLWIDPLDAIHLSPACPQVKDPIGHLLGADQLEGLRLDQNCQYLSITIPTEKHVDGPGPFPVLVWIHGGAYLVGAGDAKIYDPSIFVHEQDIIVVNVSYRLGLFGYVGDGKERAANLGLLDQLEALRWVRANLAAFGGDVENVTVAGQSAGGDAVVHLLALDEMPQLVKRAIIQSAPLGIRPGRKDMLAALVNASTHITTHSSVDEVLQATEDMVKYAKKNFRFISGMPLATQYGVSPLPAEDSLEEAWKRNSTKIDIMIGNTREEVTMFLATLPSVDFICSLPLVGNFVKSRAVQYFTNSVYETDTRQFATMYAQDGGRATLYKFEWAVRGNKYQSPHAMELHLLFGNEEAWKLSKLIEGASWSEVDEKGRLFRTVWGDFVKGQLKDEDTLPDLLHYHTISAKA